MGETQEIDAVLQAFSSRYFDCNSSDFASSDIVHSIVFSLLLLNTDLHSVSSLRHKKMTRKEYLRNTGLPSKYDEMLRTIYDNIKATPLPSAVDESSKSGRRTPRPSTLSVDFDSPQTHVVLFTDKLARKNLTRGYSKARNRRYSISSLTEIISIRWVKANCTITLHTENGLLLEMYSASSSSNLDGSSSLLDTYSLQHALARPLPPPGYSETRKHVLVLHLSNKSTDLFQAESSERLMMIVNIINYYAACMSREPAVTGTGSACFGWESILTPEDGVKLEQWTPPTIRTDRTRYQQDDGLGDQISSMKRCLASVAREISEHDAVYSAITMVCISSCSNVFARTITPVGLQRHWKTGHESKSS